MTSRYITAFRSIRRLIASGRRGAVAVEMALIALPFFYLFIGTMELSLVFAAQQLMESATYNASRLGSIGFSNPGQTQLQTVTQTVTNELQSFGTLFNGPITITPTTYNSFAQANAQIGGVVGSTGGPGQVVVYKVSYLWTFFTPLIGALVGTCSGPVCTTNLTSQIVVYNQG